MYKLDESQRIKDIEEKFGGSLTTLFYRWHWKENLKHKEIARRIGIPRSTITRWFRYFHIPTQSCARFTNLNLEKHRQWLKAHKKPKIIREFPWHFNTDFFKEWSAEMSYVLGFLLADGYVFQNPRGSHFFCFSSTDREILKKIRVLLGSNHKIGVRKKRNPNWKTEYVLQIGSKAVVEDLKRFGIVQNKSLTLRFPGDIPDVYLPHLIRGYFDGDGCVYLKKHLRKNRNKLTWVFQVRFTSGSKRFIEGLRDVLATYTTGGHINTRARAYDLVFSHADGFALFVWMYHNVSSAVYLKRKYETFVRAQKVLNMGS